jgi:hypothetical protein
MPSSVTGASSETQPETDSSQHSMHQNGRCVAALTSSSPYKSSGLMFASESIPASIAALAEGGEILVSSTVKDLVAGSGIEFADAGGHELRGIPGTWQLYRPAIASV